MTEEIINDEIIGEKINDEMISENLNIENTNKKLLEDITILKQRIDELKKEKEKSWIKKIYDELKISYDTLKFKILVTSLLGFVFGLWVAHGVIMWKVNEVIITKVYLHQPTGGLYNVIIDPSIPGGKNK